MQTVRIWLLDELACLTRDLLVMKTAPGTGITMLSGVASDREVSGLVERFSSGELVRMMNLIQQTMTGFTRSASRRMDAELCILNLCQPELQLDADSLNARLTKLEEQLRTGHFVAARPQEAAPVPDEQEEMPPIPDDDDAPPPTDEDLPQTPAPAAAPQVGAAFWPDLLAAVRKELKPPASGFFVQNQNSPVKGAMRGSRLELRCINTFVTDAINKPDILEVVSRKASAMLGRPISVTVVDLSAKPAANPRMEQLLNFGKAHSDIINIKQH